MAISLFPAVCCLLCCLCLSFPSSHRACCLLVVRFGSVLSDSAPGSARSLSSSLAWLHQRTSGHANAQVAAPVRRHAPAAGRRPADPRGVLPAPAPVHPFGALWRPPIVLGILPGIGAMPVLAPLPHIPVHVEQSPPVAQLGANCFRT